MKIAIAGAALTVLSISLPVLAATTIRYQFKGQNAFASFSQYDECNSKSVSVYAFTGRSKEGSGAPTQQMGADVSYSNYNFCTGTYSAGFGSSPNAKFTIDNQLNSATLTGTFVATEYESNTPKTVEVNVTWTGTDFSSKGKSSYVSQTPTSIITYRSNGEFRDAKVSGSVIVDGTNLTANTSVYGNLSSSTNGTFERITK